MAQIGLTLSPIMRLPRLSRSTLFPRHGRWPLQSRYLTAYGTPEGTSLSRQKDLKKWPVAPLAQTLSRYQKTIRPFLSQDEWTTSQRTVAQFGQPGGYGERLQALLEAKAQTTNNWFADWWLDCAYLGSRGTVVVWSSPGFVWPEQQFAGETDQLEYAAKVVAGLLDFKLMLDKQCLPVEMMGQDPMDMEQYYMVYGTTRMPGKTKDYLSLNPNSKHMVVIHHNNFYRVSLYDDEGHLLSEPQIFGSLLHCVKDSREKGRGPAVGLLTSDNRDNWFQAYEKLLPGNENTLKAIETSLFTLNLDQEPSNQNGNTYPDQKTKTAAQAIHGLGPNGHAANRWFDKTMQVFIGSDGSCGMCYEHSTAEGVALMTVIDHTLRCVNGGTKFGPPSKGNRFDCPEFLPFRDVDQVRDNITLAHNNLYSLSEDLDLRAMHFKGFGKSFIKRQKFSPDSFMQMALQYAFYRLHKTPGGQYESGGLRIFHRGRTDIIRSCSVESVRFAQDMLNNSVSTQNKFQSMANALKGHSNFAKMVVSGNGFDRHLLGLKLIALEHGLEVPEIFNDPGYKRSTYHRISSSQVSAKSESFLAFGPLVMNGYGCLCVALTNQSLSDGGDTFFFFLGTFLASTSSSSLVSSVEILYEDTFLALLRLLFVLPLVTRPPPPPPRCCFPADPRDEGFSFSSEPSLDSSELSETLVALTLFLGCLPLPGLLLTEFDVDLESFLRLLLLLGSSGSLSESTIAKRSMNFFF
eukprot:TCALIF_03579-PA protein Name:"Similar to CRAT Carnitine O-acetyltransferase (Columba livia)" AED:0.31 eAED:0.31 QI:419/0.9/0.81/1/0.7/0.63/11/0/744